MLEAYGSKDDLEDIIEALDKTATHYVLSVMIPGESRTLLFSDVSQELAEEAGHNLLEYCEELAEGLR